MDEEEMLAQMVLDGRPPLATKVTENGLEPDPAQQGAIVEIQQRHLMGQSPRFISTIMRKYRKFPGHETFDARKILRIIRKLLLYLDFVEVSEGIFEKALFVREPVLSFRALRKWLKDENEVNRFLILLKKQGFPFLLTQIQ